MKTFLHSSKLKMAIWTGLSLSMPLTTWAATDCAIVTELDKAQCSALLSLYDSTGGANWTANNGWSSGTNAPCSWKGITCKGGNVTSLVLPKNNLKGTLPDLSAFSGLVELNLNDNGLTGTLPDVSNLTKLQVLDLGDNDLSGTLPKALASLTNLKTLVLNGNAFTGTIPPLDALVGLVTFNCNDNQLSSTLPELNALTSLKTLTCKANQLSGPIPALEALTLQTVDLSSQTVGDKSVQLCLDTTIKYGANGDKLTGVSPCKTTVYGVKWADHVANGVIDDGEKPFANETETITLKSTTSTETPVPTFTASTNDLGEYVITDLPPDTYEVTTTSIPAGWVQGADATAYTVTLEEGQTAKVNFGVRPPNAINIDMGTASGYGVVTLESTSGTFSCKGTCEVHYPLNEEVKLTLTATEAANQLGFLFPVWDGDCGKTKKVQLVDPTDPTRLTNVFEEHVVPDTTNPKTVTIAATPKNCTAEVKPFSCQLLPDNEISEAECFALFSLYDGTNGNLSTNHENWLTTLTPCADWHGLDCGTDKNGKKVVTKVELPSNKLDGTLAKDFLLPSLQSLDLSGNPELKGALPEWVKILPAPADGSAGGLNVSDTGFCRKVNAEYGYWHEQLLSSMKDCPLQMPKAMFTMSTVTPPLAVDNGYTVQLDASRSTSHDGLIHTYYWTVSNADEDIKEYYHVDYSDLTNHPNGQTLLSATPVEWKSNTPKPMLTFPPDKPETIYRITLVVQDVITEKKGIVTMGSGAGNKSQPTERLAPIPMSTLVLSRFGDGTGTITASQVEKTVPPLPGVSCCLRYPEEYYNGFAGKEALLIADVAPAFFTVDPAGKTIPQTDTTSDQVLSGSEFSGWSGDGCLASTQEKISLPLTAWETKTCVAEFGVVIPPPTGMHKLTVTTEGEGDGYVSARDGTISCDCQADGKWPNGDLKVGTTAYNGMACTKTNCTENYPDYGGHVTLKAVPGLFSSFTGWTGDAPGCAVAGKKLTATVIMSPFRNVSCTANFDLDSNTGGAMDASRCYAGDCEPDTGETMEALYPQTFMNVAQLREALSFVEAVKKAILEPQLDMNDLANTWPTQLNDVELYKPKMVDGKKLIGMWTESVRIRQNANVDGTISDGVVDGYYIEVRVWLRKPNLDEEGVPILVPYEPSNTKRGERRFVKAFVKSFIGFIWLPPPPPPCGGNCLKSKLW